MENSYLKDNKIIYFDTAYWVAYEQPAVSV